MMRINCDVLPQTISLLEIKQTHAQNSATRSKNLPAIYIPLNTLYICVNYKEINNFAYQQVENNITHLPR